MKNTTTALTSLVLAVVMTHGCRDSRQAQTSATTATGPVTASSETGTVKANALTQPAWAEPKTNLKEAEVIRIAEDTAKAEGIDLERYEMTGCHYQYTRKDKTWTVFFTAKPPTPPGGHFQVWVNDQTKQARFMRGE